MGALAGREDRICGVLTNNPGGRSWHLSILFRTTVSPVQDYPIRISWHRLILFRTTQLFQELLFKLVLLKLPKSKTFQKSFNTFSNQITCPLLKTLHPSYVQMDLPLNVKIFKHFFKNYFFVQTCQIFSSSKSTKSLRGR